MVSSKAGLLVFSLATLGLLIAVNYTIDQARSFEPDLTRLVETSTAPGQDLARAGLRALKVGDADAAKRLFLRALEMAPANARWEYLLRSAELELKVQQRRANYTAPVDPRSRTTLEGDSAPETGDAPESPDTAGRDPSDPTSDSDTSRDAAPSNDATPQATAAP